MPVNKIKHPPHSSPSAPVHLCTFPCKLYARTKNSNYLFYNSLGELCPFTPRGHSSHWLLLVLIFICVHSGGSQTSLSNKIFSFFGLCRWIHWAMNVGQIAVGIPFPRFQQTPPTWPRVAGRLSACQPLWMLRLIFHVPFPRYSSGIGCTDNWVWPVTILHHISLVCSWPDISLLGYPGYLHREGPAGRCDVNVMQIVCVLHECCWLGGEKHTEGKRLNSKHSLSMFSVHKSP